MNDEAFRSLILALPEVTEGEHSGRATFHVRGRRFATLGWPDAGIVALILDPEHLDLLLETVPSAVARAPGAWGRRGHARLNLGLADEATVRSVVTMALGRSAPTGLVKALHPLG